MTSPAVAAGAATDSAGQRSVWPLLFCCVFLAVQLALPVVRLAQDYRPARWGWQMYAGYGANSVEYRVVAADGAVKDVDDRDYLAVNRGDLPMERYLPGHICRTTNAREVQISVEEAPWERLPCD